MTSLLLVLLQVRVLTLDEALKTARAHQPQLRQAQAQVRAAEARRDEARAPLLPQVQGQATYQRSTANYAPRPGNLPGSVGTMATRSSFDTFNYFAFGLSANQLVYDFGQQTSRFRASRASAEAQAKTAQVTELDVEESVRAAYFSARAQKSLEKVAEETLANQERHLKQVQGFVEVGTRPEIDLAQARTDRANARVALIQAENGYATARAQLNQAMGAQGPIDYEVGDEAPEALKGEDAPWQTLSAEAQGNRPELASLEAQLRAQSLSLRAVKGAYGPTLGVSTSLTDAGTQIDALVWNWSGLVTLNWPLFQGLLTRSQVREEEAKLASLEAERDTLKLQIDFEVTQAQLAVRAAKGALDAAGEALQNARERLRLAEGRYQTGVGSIIELGDAQVALAQAGAQRVQAEYALASARAQLLRSLGRR